MMKPENSLNHSKWECKYHIVWIPKYRKKSIYKDLRKYLGATLKDLALQKECTIEEGHLMSDHVHILISIPPKYSVTQVVGFIKGKSAISISQVAQLSIGAPYADSLNVPKDKAQQKMLACRSEFKQHVAELLDQLESVMHPARAARVIAANSRIEASQAGDYLQSLQAVAESVDNAAQVIHDNVQRCKSALSVINI